MTNSEIENRKNIVNNIKKHHWKYGYLENDYLTTNANTYLYDKNAAKFAKNNLNNDVINRIRATNYKLG
jgi:hypothetical protein